MHRMQEQKQFTVDYLKFNSVYFIYFYNKIGNYAWTNQWSAALQHLFSCKGVKREILLACLHGISVS